MWLSTSGQMVHYSNHQHRCKQVFLNKPPAAENVKTRVCVCTYICMCTCMWCRRGIPPVSRVWKSPQRLKMWRHGTAILIIIEGQFQILQRFPVVNWYKNRWKLFHGPQLLWEWQYVGLEMAACQCVVGIEIGSLWIFGHVNKYSSDESSVVSWFWLMNKG